MSAAEEHVEAPKAADVSDLTATSQHDLNALSEQQKGKKRCCRVVRTTMTVVPRSSSVLFDSLFHLCGVVCVCVRSQLGRIQRKGIRNIRSVAEAENRH